MGVVVGGVVDGDVVLVGVGTYPKIFRSICLCSLKLNWFQK